MLTFAEELVLLPIDEDGGLLTIRTDAFECALTGAALMDLAFAWRIDTDLRALVVNDRTPTGNPVLDRILEKIAALDMLVFEPVTGRDVTLTSARNYRALRARGIAVRKTIDIPGVGLNPDSASMPRRFSGRQVPRGRGPSRRGAGGRPGRRAPRADDPDYQPLDAADVQPRAFGFFASERN